MKRKIAEQIEKMEKKYHFHNRPSILARNQKNIKTQPNYQDHFKTYGRYKNSLDMSKFVLSENNDLTKATETPYSERQNNSLIGKRYFDIKMHRAESQYKKFTSKKVSLNLPKLKPNFQTELYQESHHYQLPKFDGQYEIRKRALRKVDQIYAEEQQIVNQKYQKIKRIKDRLKILDKIKFDKQKLKNKYRQLSNQ